MPSPLPYMEWYPRDFLSSSATMCMSLEEQGAYRRLLDIQWEDGAIPNDPRRIAGLLGIPGQMENFERIWAIVGPQFKETAEGLQNPRLAHDRKAAFIKAEAATEKGRENARKRWSGKKNADSNASSIPSSNATPMQTQCSPTSTTASSNGAKAPGARTAKIVFGEFRSLLPVELMTRDVQDELAAVLKMRSDKRMGQWAPDTVRRLAKEWADKPPSVLRAALSKTATCEYRAVIFERQVATNGHHKNESIQESHARVMADVARLKGQTA